MKIEKVTIPSDTDLDDMLKKARKLSDLTLLLCRIDKQLDKLGVDAERRKSILLPVTITAAEAAGGAA